MSLHRAQRFFAIRSVAPLTILFFHRYVTPLPIPFFCQFVTLLSIPLGTHDRDICKERNECQEHKRERKKIGLVIKRNGASTITPSGEGTETSGEVLKDSSINKTIDNRGDRDP